MRPLVILALAGATSLVAQTIPSQISFQGRLTDNTPAQAPVNATVPMRFTIWNDPTAGTILWQEPASGGTPVLVVNGIFNVALGGNGVPLPASLFTGATSDRYLETTLNPGASQEILAPRQRITASGYAALAENANSAASAVSATTAGSATNAANLGGQPAANYLLTTGTAADSSQLGGVAASGWQKKLTTPACPVNQSLNTLNADGTTVCASPPATAGALDFGTLYLPSSGGGGVAIAAGASIPFPNTSFTAAAGTTLAYTQPNLTIGDAGTYQVTWGVNASTISNCTFQLQLNGAGVSNGLLDTGNGKQMTSTTTLVPVASAGLTLRVINSSGVACTLNNGSATVFGAPCAYLSILRLR